MARGFESKSVMDQQEAATAARDRAREAAAAATTSSHAGPDRRRLELARADVVQKLELARAEPHRQMLHATLAAIDAEMERTRQP